MYLVLKYRFAALRGISSRRFSVKDALPQVMLKTHMERVAFC
jgi:hypothetical protein